MSRLSHASAAAQALRSTLSTGNPAGPEEHKRVTMMLDELERELLTQRSSGTFHGGHRVTGSVSTTSSTIYAAAAAAAAAAGPGSSAASASNHRSSGPMGPPPSEPLPQLPTFPSTSSSSRGSTSGSRPSSSVTRQNSSASGGGRSGGASSPATSTSVGTENQPESSASTRQETWINGLIGPRASSTFSRTSFDSTHHVTARYTICAADDDEDNAGNGNGFRRKGADGGGADDAGNLSDDSRVLSLSNYHSFSNHDGMDDDERLTAVMPHSNNSSTDRSNALYSNSPSPTSLAGPSTSHIGSSGNRISTSSALSGAPSTLVPTVMIDDVDELSDDTADWDDSEGDDGGDAARKKRRKKPNKNRWRFEDQRVVAPSLSRATAARLTAASSGPSVGSSFLAPSAASSAGPSSFQIGTGGPPPASSTSLAAGPFAPPGPSSFTPGAIVPPSASEFTFYEFAPDLPPFAPKDLTPKDLTGTGTWRSIVARAVTSATANASHRGSIAGDASSIAPGQHHSGPVSVRQLAAETRARQQRELVMRQRQAQLFAQTRLEPIDLHRHAQQMANLSSSSASASPSAGSPSAAAMAAGDRAGMSPSPAPSFSTMRSSSVLSNFTDAGEDEGGDGPGSLHRGLFRSASVSLSGYWDPLENISAYGDMNSSVGGGRGLGGPSGSTADGASVRSSTYTNPGLGLDFQRQQMMQPKIYADSGTQTSPTSSPSNSRPGSPDAVNTGGVGGESLPADSVRAPRKVLADGGTQTDDRSSSKKRSGGGANGGESDDTEQGEMTPSNERTPVKSAAGSAAGASSRSRPPLINRRRSTLGIGGPGGASRLASGGLVVEDEPEGWRTPVRAPRLSSRKSNIGTSPRTQSPRSSTANGMNPPSAHKNAVARRTSTNTLVRKPLSPLGLGQGMNRDELDMFNGLSQTDGSDAGISSEDDSDSDAGSCESDLDLNTPLEELAERSGALSVANARGEKRKFEVQRRAAGSMASAASNGLKSSERLSPYSSSTLSLSSGRDGAASSRVVAPLPRGLRQAGAQGRLGPKGQIGGGRTLGAGLRAGGARTTAVAYSSDEEDATATETEHIHAAMKRLAGGVGAGAGTGGFPRSPASLTQSKIQMRQNVFATIKKAGEAAAARAEPAGEGKVETVAEKAERDEADASSPQTPVLKTNGLPGHASREKAGSVTPPAKVAGTAALAPSPSQTPTRPPNKDLALEHSPPQRGISIPELDEMLKAQDRLMSSLAIGGVPVLAEDVDAALATSQGSSKSTLGDDEDLLTSDIDFAMPPSGDSFQSIDDLDGLLDSPHQPNGYGVRSVTGTASMRKPISVPALVTERLAGLAISEASPPKAAANAVLLPRQGSIAKKPDGALQADGYLGHDAVGDDDVAYASSTIHGHSRVARPGAGPSTPGAKATAAFDADGTPLAGNIELPAEPAGSPRTQTVPSTPARNIGVRSSLPSPSVTASQDGKRSSVASSVSTPKASSEAKGDDGVATPTPARQRSTSQASRIRAPSSGRSSLPSSAVPRSGLRQPGSISGSTGAARKGSVGGPMPITSTGVAHGVAPTAPPSANKSLRKMKSFGDRSSSTFVSPSISTMPRARLGQTPSPELTKGGMSSGSSRPGSAAATRRSISTHGPSRPPSSTSMRRSVIPARKNSDALPSNLPQPPTARSSIASTASTGPQRALSPTTPKKTTIRSPALGVERRPSQEAVSLNKTLIRKGSAGAAAGAGVAALIASPVLSSGTTDTSPQSQYTPTLSSRTSSMSSNDSPPMPSTPGPLPGARRMASASNLRKPSAIARPSGLPTPNSRASALPLPKSYKV